MASWPTVGELEAYRQQAIPEASTEAAELALEIARGQVQGFTGQRIERVEDDEAVLRGVFRSELELPQRPVVSVSAVSVDGLVLAAGGFELAGYKLRRLDGQTWAGRGWPTPGAVSVTYTHGFAEIPADIRGVVLSLASRLFRNPDSLANYRIGTYSVAYAGGGVGPGLLASEEKVLRRYGRGTRSVPIGSGR